MRGCRTRRADKRNPLMQAIDPQTREMNYANRLIDMMTQRLPDDFEVRRIEASLNRLRQQPGSDLATCFHAISLARVLRMDRDGALDAARNAVHMNPVSPALHINLISTFLHLAEIDAAAKVADRCRGRFRGDLQVLTAMLLAYVYAFRFEDALAVCQEGSGRRDHAPRFNACAFDTSVVENLMRLRDEHGYTEATLQEVFNVAVGVLVDAGAGPLRFSRAIMPDGSVMHHFHVDRSVKECAALDWAIADRLVERFDKTGSELMSLCCLPVTTYHDLQPGAAK